MCRGFAFAVGVWWRRRPTEGCEAPLITASAIQNQAPPLLSRKSLIC